MKKPRTHTLDAAGRRIHVGDTVGGVTSKLVTVVGELIQVGTSKIKVRLEEDGVPVKPGNPARDDELWITAERTFLVHRADKSRQVLFTGTVDPDLTAEDRQVGAWLLLRALNGCDCTDPDPVTCTATCGVRPRRAQCRCHYAHTAEELHSLLTRVRDLDPLVADLEEHLRHMTEVYNESGCRDSDAQRWAREFLAHHARSLAVALRMVRPFVTEDSGHVFGAGYSAGVEYLRAYAYGLDPDGEGRK